MKITDKKFAIALETLQHMNSSERVSFFAWGEQDAEESKQAKLLLWWYYYFHNNFVHDLAPFHYDWLYALTRDHNILIKGFRGSIKTELTKAYAVNSICYNRWNFIVWQSYESSASEDALRNIARMLRNPLIMYDYGELFPLSSPKEDLAKKSISNFNTTNGVKVMAKSLGEKLRGAVSYDETTGSSRPDLLILDDIDVSDSVRSYEIIEKNYNKITGETIGAMSKERSRIIFLGNVINTDGVVPRFEDEKSNDPNWQVFIQALYRADGGIAWGFFTPDRVQKIKSNEGPKAFSQNYLLIPISNGNPFFVSTSKLFAPEYIQDEKYPEIYLYRKPEGLMVYGVDTAKGGINGDYSVVSIRGVDGRLFAFYQGHIPPDELHDQIINRLFELGYYGRLAIESNNMGIATITKAKEGRWKSYLYAQKVIDERTNKPTKKLGWDTNGKTRPLMLAELEEAYRTGVITEVDPRLLKEIPTFVYSDQGKPEAAANCHDDCVIADAICWQMRHHPFVTF